MKKIISSIIILSLLFTLIGCEDNTKPTQERYNKQCIKYEEYCYLDYSNVILPLQMGLPHLEEVGCTSDICLNPKIHSDKGECIKEKRCILWEWR